MSKSLDILFVEPFYADSHKQWLDQLIEHSSHSITKLTLPGKFWKWRMHGAAVTLAKQFIKTNIKYDLIICSSMLDVTTFSAIARVEIKDVPLGIYFHENQISYPWKKDNEDVKLQRDRHYGFINYTSALTADQVYFNSNYHLHSFLDSLLDFLSAFPDFKNIETIEEIRAKSQVLNIGLDFNFMDRARIEHENRIPHIVWNHRWEFDKNPELFFETLFRLKTEGEQFKLIVLGRQYQRYPSIFDLAKDRLQEELVHWGYASSQEDYYEWLWKSDIAPITSIQDFFGISVVEAIYCKNFPLLPKRLAYPEHLDEDEYFYEDDEQFYLCLKKLLSGFRSCRYPNLASITKYKWENIIHKYDTCFSQLAQKSKEGMSLKG